jgi:signal transduction histidine kinase/CheY-like chemotaxis protein/HPt (histidine-containing phosphotransfer) domain-containing protein
VGYSVFPFISLCLGAYSLVGYMFIKQLGFLAMILGVVIATLPLTAHAQTNPAPQSIQYQAIQLTDTEADYDFEGKVYALKETDIPLSLQTIEQMIRSGEIISSRVLGSHISIGHQETGTWIVFPIVNNSKKDSWSLDLGTLTDGRFSTLKEIILYNMNTKEYLINTRNIYEKNRNIGDTLMLKVPANQTSFFILYVKPNLTTPNFIKMSLRDPNQSNVMEILSSRLVILLAFSGFVFFLKSAKDSSSISDIFLSLSCLAFSFVLLINSRFIYFSKMDMELAYPAIWIITSQALMLSFIFVKRNRHELSLSFLGGVTSASLITNLVGLVILKSLPIIATFLIFGPVVISLMIIMGITWGSDLSNKRLAYTHIANTAFFLFILLVWVIILNFDIAPPNSVTLLFPSIILLCALSVAIISKIPVEKSAVADVEISEDIFADNQIAKKEITQIHEAKEKSEYYRLMQVIEQERKLMADLQVKSAQQNEDMRKAKEAADEANRAKSAFLAVVSHEIRTPMTGIMGMLRLLQDTQLSKDQKEYASTIKDSGDAMLALLNDILDFEKIESGKMDLENINFDLKRLIRSVHTLMRGHAEAKNVELVLEMDSQVPNWVYGDPTRMRQVLLNLINNAIKFTNKGAVYLRIRDLTGESTGLSHNVHQIYFAVQDSGIGIGSANQKKLFMPFAQADTSISRKYGGTGLGLAICKRLIEAMGGAISINSKEGEGSTFFFTISMAEGNEIFDESSDNFYSTETTPALNTKLSNSLSILIVDDNGINQKVVAGFVDKIGGKSMTAGTGADALDLHAKYQFDAILLDIELPDMNGIEVTKIIRALQIPSKAKLPIIALTGNTQDEDVRNYLAAGMSDFAGKPITFEKISEILHKIDNGFYINKGTYSNIGFSEDKGDDENEEEDDNEEENLNEISPLAAYTSQMGAQFDSSPAVEDDPEEDTFAVAVKKFEEMERANATLLANKASGGSELTQAGLDEAILNSLKAGLSVPQIQEILVSFYEKADELIADLGNAYLGNDAIALNARAHELKGMAGNFGFSELSKMCGIIEKAGKDNQLDAAKDPIEHLGENYAIARGFLNKWLNQ